MSNQNRWTGTLVGIVMGALLSAAVVLAGSLEPSVGPNAAGSQMYTLEQIYNRINNGPAATKMTTFTEPSSGPTAGTMHTLDEIYILAGQRAPVPRTGQTQTVPLNPAPTGSDGDLRKGVTPPNPRFTDNGNGTVTDNLTGLIWLKNANCFVTNSWETALSDANGLASGSCDLTDGSVAGDWRLPNIKELQSLIDFAYYKPALPNTAGTGHWVEGDPFTGVQSVNYWSSSSSAEFPSSRWILGMWTGFVGYASFGSMPVWPVRSGK